MTPQGVDMTRPGKSHLRLHHRDEPSRLTRLGPAERTLAPRSCAWRPKPATLPPSGEPEAFMASSTLAPTERPARQLQDQLSP